ncbi:hypothetical protein DCS_03998 [Drechmeria coniospora]|uniref:Uncharacterized protein n=1 Tax=Drechmeria coniospora TaxID=98403 RepID=A0A151GIW7_DRECN|nr:hypothetical protein DCS_03998 [Drechmeria coniospora]KYK56991.1 hypothetical protein DCS_03998 [Drechmeria coniospora]ODA78273.1 hypothetical protein RJ55_05654 [Drechmeria coniospora]
MGIITLLTLALFALRVCCEEGHHYVSLEEAIEQEIQIFKVKNELYLKRLYLSAESIPSNDVALARESTCWRNWGLTCQDTVFIRRQQLINISAVEFGAIRHEDQALTTGQQLNDLFKIHASKVTTKKSTAVLRSLTKGWNAGFRIVNSLAPGPSASISAEGSYDYYEESTDANTVTNEAVFEHSCLQGYHCTIQTVSFYAKVRGVCRVKPFTRCNSGEQDACYGFRKVLAKDASCAARTGKTNFRSLWGSQAREPLKVDKNNNTVEVFEWNDCQQCDQFLDFSAKHCGGRETYQEEECEVIMPVRKADGSPHTHVVFTSIPRDEYLKKYAEKYPKKGKLTPEPEPKTKDIGPYEGKKEPGPEDGKRKREVKVWAKGGKGPQRLYYVEVLKRD